MRGLKKLRAMAIWFLYLGYHFYLSRSVCVCVCLVGYNMFFAVTCNLAGLVCSQCVRLFLPSGRSSEVGVRETQRRVWVSVCVCVCVVFFEWHGSQFSHFLWLTRVFAAPFYGQASTVSGSVHGNPSHTHSLEKMAAPLIVSLYVMSSVFADLQS